MKILIVMDPGIMIPVKGYGGHERLVEMFAKEYHRLGHEVHLLITSGSSVEGCTVHDFGKEGFPPNKWDARKAMPVAWKFLWRHRNNFDLVHNFGRLAYLLPILHHPVKKIMTYGREISSRNIKMMNRIGAKHLVFTACSSNLLSRVRASGDWKVVYNSIEFGKYQLQENPKHESPLIFLGRIEKIKGCHTAIRVASATGNKLIIAGNISPLPEEKAYFENEIAPHIDGVRVKHIGAVNDVQKNEWLGKAKALLFPIEWNEPFGIVMIEAMACGTPVIAFNRGSVNEVVDEGITGFKINTEAEMVDAVNRIRSIPRAACRKQALERFDVQVVAKEYLDVFRSVR
jgi:glycosyltransferase involved in cell wall biosynthesis